MFSCAHNFIHNRICFITPAGAGAPRRAPVPRATAWPWVRASRFELRATGKQYYLLKLVKFIVRYLVFYYYYYLRAGGVRPHGTHTSGTAYFTYTRGSYFTREHTHKHTQTLKVP